MLGLNNLWNYECTQPGTPHCSAISFIYCYISTFPGYVIKKCFILEKTPTSMVLKVAICQSRGNSGNVEIFLMTYEKFQKQNIYLSTYVGAGGLKDLYHLTILHNSTENAELFI